MEKEREKYTNIQKEKFERLASNKKSTPGLDTKRTVVNISKRSAMRQREQIYDIGGKNDQFKKLEADLICMLGDGFTSTVMDMHHFLALLMATLKDVRFWYWRIV
ncbi:unnamed protein product [Callosobruchus maculatus]|uniref:Uncharacterized protein n=1 Tax=Callosobruchus maculatus TaxID=64391 RepID=A0A653D7A6_CALMS|nr:unnamed protein product [Callosobruchus maculatus]